MPTSSNVDSTKCPSCGAPVKPRGSDPLVTCPFCHGFVLVPEALRQLRKDEPWSVFLYEDFVANSNRWIEGEYRSEYFAPLKQQIAEGRYRWQAQTKRPNSMSTAWVDGYWVRDFELNVNCKHTAGTKTGSSWGLIFRVHDNRNYCWYRMTETQLFAFSVVKDGEWHNLINWTRSSTIKPYGVNQLGVLAIGAHFVLSINGHVVMEIEEEGLSEGFIGVAIEGYSAGEKTCFDFLDLILRTP